MGLWKHNRKYHIDKMTTIAEKRLQNDFNINLTENNKKFECEFCSNTFTRKNNLNNHIKNVCKKNKSNVKNEIIVKLNKLENELEKIKLKPLTINNIHNINNGTINKGPIINNFLNKTGNENLSVISEKEIEYIMDQEMNSIITLINMLNFNEDFPENHTFCTTSLNDKYISTINIETLTIEKQRKKDFYDSLLYSGLNKIKLLLNKLTSKSKKEEYKNTIDNLTEYVLISDKGKKAYLELVNALTFNKRELVQSTWIQLKNNQIPETKRDNYKVDIKPIKLAKKLIVSDSDSEFSESDDGEPDSVKIIHKGKQYLVINNFLHIINDDSTPGKVTGSYISNKVKLFTNKKDIDL